MYCHFTLMNKLNVKRNGKMFASESFLLNVLCYGRDVCMYDEDACLWYCGPFM